VQTISPTSLVFVAQTLSAYSQGNMEKFWGDWRLHMPMPIVIVKHARGV